MGKPTNLRRCRSVDQPQQPPNKLNKSSGNLKKRHRNTIRFAQFKFPLGFYFYRRYLAAHFLPFRFHLFVGLIHLQNNKVAALQAGSIAPTCWELFSAYANFNSSYGDFFLNLLEFFLNT
ncbi:hypothetical protein [uncultured Alloprevotella sp.]|uniref:hypothetical protein n=1 Tax=uncultured Alloprevotella sp. TaxID=1283315 RepID=UPI0026330BEA|nr:hypothetical protein [uncultured Alloprevotella sp.]